MKKRLPVLLTVLMFASIMNACVFTETMDRPDVEFEEDNETDAEDKGDEDKNAKDDDDEDIDGEDIDDESIDATGANDKDIVVKDAGDENVDAKGADDENNEIENRDKADNEPYNPDITFSTYDVINETNVDETIFKDHKVTMVNFWEPWCGPCVSEMPDIEKLYVDLGAGSGDFAIIGVYATEEDAMETLKNVGTTYPVLRFVPEFMPLLSDYVPNTVFFDQNGHIIKSKLADQDGFIFIGSRSYNDWKNIMETLGAQ